MAHNENEKYNQDWDQNQRRSDRENDYNQNYGYNQNRDRQSGYGSSGSYGNTSSGNQYGGQHESNPNQQYNAGTGNLGSGYSGHSGSSGGWKNRDDNDRSWGNTGSNYGGQGRSQQRNMYGGDTSNYGNANQGGYNRDWWDRTKDEVASWFGGNDNDRNRGDRRVGGEHKGKGPKGYVRSDERIREDAHDRLADDPYVDASDIEVKVEKCEVVLTGNVSDRDQKRRAEDVVESVSGVRHVENRLRVNRERSSDTGTTQRHGNYTGTTTDAGGIGSESGTTNEIIRNTGNMNTR